MPGNGLETEEGTEGPQLAVVGCGFWGRNLVRNFSALGALRYVVDTATEGRDRAQEVAPQADVTDRLDEALAAGVSGVVIATPAETHYRLARTVLEADRDCFVEKPLTTSYREGAELVRLAAQRHRILMVGHVLEYHPAIVKLLDLVAHGRLGKVNYIYSNRLSLGKVRREENILWSFAPHDIGIILRLLGTLPFEVVACGGSYLQPNIADVTITNLLFDNGVRAHIHVSWLHPFKEQRLVVIGSERMATFDDVRKELVLYDQRVEWRESEPIPIRGEGQTLAFDGAEPLRLECQGFLDAITSRTAPPTDGRSGLRVLRVLRAAQRSLVRNGQPTGIPLDPAFS